MLKNFTLKISQNRQLTGSNPPGISKFYRGYTDSINDLSFQEDASGVKTRCG